MKTLLITLLLLLTLSPNLFALDECMGGSWYDIERDGEGVDISVHDGVTFGYFFTHGSAGTVWYTFSGKDVLTVRGTRKTSEDPFKAFTVDVGAAVIVPLTDNLIRFKYDLTLDVDDDKETPWCLSKNCKGDFIYDRLTQVIPCD